MEKKEGGPTGVKEEDRHGLFMEEDADPGGGDHAEIRLVEKE